MVSSLCISFYIFMQTENAMELPNFVKNDQWLEPFAPTIISRLNIAREKEHEILRNVSL